MNPADIVKLLAEAADRLAAPSERGAPPAVEVPRDLRFDDEPMDALLYDGSCDQATPVSIFQPAQELVDSFETDGIERSPADKVRKVVEFLEDGHALPKEMSRSLTTWLRGFLPQWPTPPSKDMPPEVGMGLELLWRRANERAEDDLRLAVGSALWEWYEWQKRHADARRVLQILIDIHLRQGRRGDAASQTNNYAFQYWLECNWPEAGRHFERASRLEAELGRAAGYASSQTNYWACRFEEEDLASQEVMTSELERFADVLRQAGNTMGERKALVYLAKIAERQDRLDRAIELIGLAIKLDHRTHSVYTETDERFLEVLNSRRVAKL